MVMINTIKVIIYIIMYTYSIATTSFQGDDSITAQLLHCFQSYLLLDFSNENIIHNILYHFNIFLQKLQCVFYNMRDLAISPIMRIKRYLQFNFSARLGRKVCFSENRVIVYKGFVINLKLPINSTKKHICSKSVIMKFKPKSL